MKVKIVFVLLVIALALVAVNLAGAQDDTIGPPNPLDNLCFEGGAWDDGRCDIPTHFGSTELAWECGWYMARLYRGVIGIDAIPDQCEHLLKEDKFVLLT